MREIDDKTHFDPNDCLIYVSAPWCVPCRTMGNMLERAVDAIDVPVYKIDADKSPATAGLFNVRNVPTLILYRGGVEVNRCGVIQNVTALKAFVG